MAHMSDCVKLLLKLMVLLMFLFSTSSTKQGASNKTERDGYVIRNVGIKLCQLKCAENGQCLSVEYDSKTLTCRLSRDESKKIKTKEGYVILARDHSHVPTGSCTSSMCSFGQRCLKTRSGKDVCVQDEKQNDPEKSPQHKVDKLESFPNCSLLEACRKGDLNRVTNIVFHGLYDVNFRDEKHGRTPLMVAAQEGHCEIFAILIREGANKSDVDNDGKSVLHWACKGGHADMVKCVLRQYRILKSSTMPVLIKVAWKGYKDVFQFLECMGSNVSQVDHAGNNALHWACSGGHLAMVKYIAAQGSIDINSRSKGGKTPLMKVAWKGDIDVFDFLVSIGGNASQVDNNGQNVLHLASFWGKVEMVKHILSQNLVDINARDKKGETAAMIAKRRRADEVYTLLVS